MFPFLLHAQHPVSQSEAYLCKSSESFVPDPGLQGNNQFAYLAWLAYHTHEYFSHKPMEVHVAVTNLAEVLTRESMRTAITISSTVRGSMYKWSVPFRAGLVSK